MIKHNTFQKAYVLLPYCRGEVIYGGQMVAEQLADLLCKYIPAAVVTYQNREAGIPFLPDMSREQLDNSLCIITWGPHINQLQKVLNGQRVVYYAQSFGWDINLSPYIPILCVSRYVMSQWTYKAPHNPVFLLPPAVSKQCTNENGKRDIDVLVISKKSSDYLSDRLLPELSKKYNVHIQKDHIPQHELYQLYKRSKIYIYSTPAILSSGGQEGFGLQPMEAIICGCRVFSNLNGGLCDYLEPSCNMSQISEDMLAYDLHRIEEACVLPPPSQQGIDELAGLYSPETACRRLETILPELDKYFSFHATAMADPGIQGD